MYLKFSPTQHKACLPHDPHRCRPRQPSPPLPERQWSSLAINLPEMGERQVRALGPLNALQGKQMVRSAGFWRFMEPLVHKLAEPVLSAV